MAAERTGGNEGIDQGAVGSAGQDANGFIDPALAARIESGGSDSGSPGGNGEYGFRKDGTPAKKRGRKPGSGSGRSGGGNSKRAADSVSVKGLEKILLSVHGMGAMLLKTPEFQIDESEAKLLAEAVNAVQQHYQIEASETAIIWTNLCGALIAVYGPRFIALAAKKKSEKKAKPQKAAPNGEVIAFPNLNDPFGSTMEHGQE